MRNGNSQWCDMKKTARIHTPKQFSYHCFVFHISVSTRKPFTLFSTLTPHDESNTPALRREIRMEKSSRWRENVMCLWHSSCDARVLCQSFAKREIAQLRWIYGCVFPVRRCSLQHTTRQAETTLRNQHGFQCCTRSSFLHMHGISWIHAHNTRTLNYML